MVSLIQNGLADDATEIHGLSRVDDKNDEGPILGRLKEMTDWHQTDRYEVVSHLKVPDHGTGWEGHLRIPRYHPSGAKSTQILEHLIKIRVRDIDIIVIFFPLRLGKL